MKKILILIVIVSNAFVLWGQSDSLIFRNGNVVVGEIKSMNRGVIIVETDYSDDDFKIELSGIKEIYTTSIISLTLIDGTRLLGTIETTSENKTAIITDTERVVIDNLDDIVFMKTVDDGFWERFNASIDIGFNITKANNLKQFTSRSNMGYDAEKWTINSYYNTLLSDQDGADSIKRVESGLTYKMLLPNDWYFPASIDFLSNTEQKLKLRTGLKLGAGKFIIHTNHIYLSAALGLNYNNENYATSSGDRGSLEGYFGTEFNMFDVGDLNFITSIVAYPSFTESKRWRSDFNFDLKYDLPLDFYISLGVTINYDNQPVEGATALDYVAQTGFGWEW